ncbi:MAG: sulfur carrier protein ThiS [Bacteroidetes bacterium]|nr:sulfur carrier protein ThiS [Bacteroidota bacterium]
MEIKINGELHNYSEPINISTVLKQIGLYDSKGIATAVNNTVIPRKEWEKHILRHLDNLMIISATKGG